MKARTTEIVVERCYQPRVGACTQALRTLLLKKAAGVSGGEARPRKEKNVRGRSSRIPDNW